MFSSSRENWATACVSVPRWLCRRYETEHRHKAGQTIPELVLHKMSLTWSKMQTVMNHWMKRVPRDYTSPTFAQLLWIHSSTTPFILVFVHYEGKHWGGIFLCHCDIQFSLMQRKQKKKKSNEPKQFILWVFRSFHHGNKNICCNYSWVNSKLRWMLLGLCIAKSLVIWNHDTHDTIWHPILSQIYHNISGVWL